MIKVERVEEPECLAKAEDGFTELDRARVHFLAGKPAKDFDFKVYGKPEVRDALHRMFKGKCAYCEHYYAGNFTEDVEHFRPKARIDTALGKINPGYWWLGSAWANLLPSCARCNKVKILDLYDGSRLKLGKGNRFPLLDEAVRAKLEGEHLNETPLLIDPSIEDPSDFFVFEIRDGSCVIVPRVLDVNSLNYMKARASIDVYGLNRRLLVKERTRIYFSILAAVKNFILLSRIVGALSGDDRVDVESKIRDESRLIISMTSAEYPHSGVSRWVAAPLLTELGVI